MDRSSHIRPGCTVATMPAALPLTGEWYRDQVEHCRTTALALLPSGADVPSQVDLLTELGYAMSDVIDVLDAQHTPTRLAQAAFDDARRTCMNALSWVCLELGTWAYDPVAARDDLRSRHLSRLRRSPAR